MDNVKTGKFIAECRREMGLTQQQLADKLNLSNTYLKKAGQIDSIEDIELLNISAQDETVEEQLSRQDEAMQIQKILHDVPDPYKEVFMWRVFAELSYKQIGQLFGKSENWACVTYHRARNMIKERLEDSKNEK